MLGLDVGLAIDHLRKAPEIRDKPPGQAWGVLCPEGTILQPPPSGQRWRPCAPVGPPVWLPLRRRTGGPPHELSMSGGRSRQRRGCFWRLQLQLRTVRRARFLLRDQVPPK